MPDKKYNLRLIGRREYVSFPQLGLSNIEAKIDTGAYTSALHCEEIYLKDQTLFFTVNEIPGDDSTKKEFRFEDFTTKKIKNSGGEMEERFIIRTVLKIGKKNIWARISLTNRDNMRYPILIGRKPLKGKFLIDVNQLHTGGPKVEKAIQNLLIP